MKKLEHQDLKQTLKIKTEDKKMPKKIEKQKEGKVYIYLVNDYQKKVEEFNDDIKNQSYRFKEIYQDQIEEPNNPEIKNKKAKKSEATYSF